MAKTVKRWKFKEKGSDEYVLLPVTKKVVKVGKDGRKRLYLKAETEDAKYSRQVPFEVFKKISAPIERD